VRSPYFRAFSAKSVNNPVARHTEQPRTCLLNRLHQPVSLHEFGENILQDVFCVAFVPYTSTNEVAQPCPLAPHSLSDPLVLFGSHPVRAHCRLHSLLQTNELAKYCKDLEKRKIDGMCRRRFNFNNPFQIATSLFSFARVPKSIKTPSESAFLRHKILCLRMMHDDG